MFLFSLFCRSLWAATNNTVGFNHMIASAPDAEAFRRGTSSGPAAYALETMYQYTAYFPDNDPREVNHSLSLRMCTIRTVCMCTVLHGPSCYYFLPEICTTFVSVPPWSSILHLCITISDRFLNKPCYYGHPVNTLLLYCFTTLLLPTLH